MLYSFLSYFYRFRHYIFLFLNLFLSFPPPNSSLLSSYSSYKYSLFLPKIHSFYSSFILPITCLLMFVSAFLFFAFMSLFRSFFFIDIPLLHFILFKFIFLSNSSSSYFHSSSLSLLQSPFFFFFVAAFPARIYHLRFLLILLLQIHSYSLLSSGCYLFVLFRFLFFRFLVILIHFFAFLILLSPIRFLLFLPYSPWHRDAVIGNSRTRRIAYSLFHANVWLQVLPVRLHTSTCAEVSSAISFLFFSFLKTFGHKLFFFFLKKIHFLPYILGIFLLFVICHGFTFYKSTNVH